MHSLPRNRNPSESNLQTIPPATNSSQPWWRGTVYNTDPSGVLGESTSKSSSMENADGRMGTSDGGLNEEDDVTKEMQTNIVSQTGPDGHYGHEDPQLQHVGSTMPPTSGEYLIPRPQFELVGHSIACAQYPYSDPYYAGMMTAFGPQSQVHPHLVGIRHTRMPLPLEMAEEPVYVNAKQYQGILRRRQSRAKAELERKLIKARKPYLHESRHQHAMRRARGCGGRFLNTKKLENGTAPSKESASSLGSNCNGNRNSSNGQKEGSMMQDMQEHLYANGDGKSCYQHNQSLQLSTFRSLSSERGEEGDCSGQQRVSIPVNQTSNRALTIQ